LHEIVDFCIKNSIKLIIPSRDQELSFWSINKFFFEKSGIKIMVSDLDAINCTLDKLAFYKRGQQLGYPVITTSLTIADIDSSSLVVKERFGAGAQSLGLNLSKTEAAKHASTLSESIFQPFISGSEYSIDIYLNLQGKLKGSVCRKREKISHGESQITITENIPELEMICTSFAKQLNLVGHCLFQVLIDNNGAFHIVECNPRFGGASALSIFVGLDSFFWLISESQGLFNELEFIKPDKPVKQIRYNCDKIAYS
jgi:carbamoyl-phosphate synthase large subunit